MTRSRHDDLKTMLERRRQACQEAFEAAALRTRRSGARVSSMFGPENGAFER